MTKSRYWVEFIDHDGIQKSIYLYGQSVEQIKVIMNEYEIVVIDNTEIAEQPYWGSQAVSRVAVYKVKGG
tara:strand:+ start:226 stop:435 length:210 start_codon:yes stop_codon:yes gene_type:complete